MQLYMYHWSGDFLLALQTKIHLQQPTQGNHRLNRPPSKPKLSVGQPVAVAKDDVSDQ